MYSYAYSRAISFAACMCIELILIGQLLVATLALAWLFFAFSRAEVVIL